MRGAFLLGLSRGHGANCTTDCQIVEWGGVVGTRNVEGLTRVSEDPQLLPSIEERFEPEWWALGSHISQNGGL